MIKVERKIKEIFSMAHWHFGVEFKFYYQLSVYNVELFLGGKMDWHEVFVEVNALHFNQI